MAYCGLYHTNISRDDMYEDRNLTWHIILFNAKGFGVAHFLLYLFRGH